MVGPRPGARFDFGILPNAKPLGENEGPRFGAEPGIRFAKMAVYQ